MMELEILIATGIGGTLCNGIDDTINSPPAFKGGGGEYGERCMG